MFQSADPYAQPTVEGWVPSLLMDAKAFHADNNMGDDLNFATVWPERESDHINAGTGCGSMQRTQ